MSRAAAPPPPPAAPVPTSGRAAPAAVTWMLWTVVATILVQATLAGLFLSVAGGARAAHSLLGVLLPWLALVLAGVAIAVRRRMAPGLPAAICGLTGLLWVQEVLGHMPEPATTAIHIPLGVGLAVYSTVLAIWARGPFRSSARATPRSAAR